MSKGYTNVYPKLVDRKSSLAKYALTIYCQEGFQFTKDESLYYLSFQSQSQAVSHFCIVFASW